MKKLVFLRVCVLWFIGIRAFAQFEDIYQHRYAQGILELANAGVVQGYDGNLFKPDQAVTRAEMLKIILVAGNIEIMSGSRDCFKDITGDERFANFVCTAKDLGIVQWYPDGNFKPNQKVSFVEALKIALVGFRVSVPDSDSSFWYGKYLDFVDKKGIFSKSEWYPDYAMTRGMMAHLVAQLLKGGQSSRAWSFVNKSPGCSKSQPSSFSTTVVVDGVERHFIMNLGSSYRQENPAKLIFGFHGRTSDNRTVAGYYDLDEAESNAVFVYPLGLPEEWPQRNWRSGGDRPKALRDYQLFDQIFQLIADQYCIDLNQVYVAGHSLGGWFTSMLNCARGNKIRGTGIVAGSPMLFPTCSAPSAAIIFHNPADSLASFAWGEQIRDKILKQNQCWPETREYPNNKGMECIEYTQCLPGAGVVFCKYFEGWHFWPGGASSMMIDFRNKQ